MHTYLSIIGNSRIGASNFKVWMADSHLKFISDEQYRIFQITPGLLDEDIFCDRRNPVIFCISVCQPDAPRESVDFVSKQNRERERKRESMKNIFERKHNILVLLTLQDRYCILTKG